MIKLRINLIRHGEKRLFLPDPALTELGVSQAEKLAQYLTTKQETKKTQYLILSSPKKRTQQTADILAKQLALTVQIDDFLNIENVMPNTPANKNKIIEHFKQYLREINDNSIDFLEIFAVTHSQEIKNFWRILGGPEKAIKDVYECGMWSIELKDNKLDVNKGLNFLWTEGDLNP